MTTRPSGAHDAERASREQVRARARARTEAVASRDETADLLAVFGLPADASMAEVGEAYRRMARELNPDSNDGAAPVALTANDRTLVDASVAYQRLARLLAP